MGKELNRLSHIDSLRGVAILLVFLVHAHPAVSGIGVVAREGLEYGQTGVQLFFVISSLTLCLSMTFRRDESKATLKFFLRRFFRIAPLYLFGIVFYYFVKTWQMSEGLVTFRVEDTFTPLNIVANALFIHGFVPSACNSIVPGGWSIGTEMAFYAIFPLVFFVAGKLRERFGLAAMLALPFAVYALSAGSITAVMKVTGWEIANNSFLYFNLINQIPVFSLGLLLFALVQNGMMKKMPRWLDFAGFLGGTALSQLAWHSGSSLAFSLMPFCAGISFLFLYNIFERTSFLNFGILRRIGQLSFSIYIFHFACISFSDQLLRKVGLDESIGSWAYFFCLCLASVVSTFFVAQISERVIEKPGLAFGKRIISMIGRKTESHAALPVREEKSTSAAQAKIAKI